MNSAAKYSVLFVTLALVVIVGQVVLHAAHTDPRDSRQIAERELTVNVLSPDEHIIGTVSVYRRVPRDFLRATRGVLALTDKRMIFVGLRPRGLLSSADVPPTFDERDFPLDTLVAVESGRAVAGLAKGVVVHTTNQTVRFAVASSSGPDAKRLVEVMERRRAGAHSAGVTEQSLRTAADADWARAVSASKQAQYYTVRTGDALGSIATRWNTTPAHLQQLNNLPDYKIRVGRSLLVRGAM